MELVMSQATDNNITAAHIPASMLALRSRALLWVNSHPERDPGRDPEWQKAFDQLYEIERLILSAPSSREALTAKLQLALQMEREGTHLQPPQLASLLEEALTFIGGEPDKAA
jgi:hypothetical protein